MKYHKIRERIIVSIKNVSYHLHVNNKKNNFLPLISLRARVTHLIWYLYQYKYIRSIKHSMPELKHWCFTTFPHTCAHIPPASTINLYWSTQKLKEKNKGLFLMHSSHLIPTNLVYSILKFTLIVFIYSNLAVSSPVKVTNIA